MVEFGDERPRVPTYFPMVGSGEVVLSWVLGRCNSTARDHLFVQELAEDCSDLGCHFFHGMFSLTKGSRGCSDLLSSLLIGAAIEEMKNK